jgi:hypothetical protein
MMMRPSGAPEAQTDAQTLRGARRILRRSPRQCVHAAVYVRHRSQEVLSPPGAHERCSPTITRSAPHTHNKKRGASQHPGWMQLTPSTDDLTYIIRQGASTARPMSDFTEALLHESCANDRQRRHAPPRALRRRSDAQGVARRRHPPACGRPWQQVCAVA